MSMIVESNKGRCNKERELIFGNGKNQRINCLQQPTQENINKFEKHRRQTNKILKREKRLYKKK